MRDLHLEETGEELPRDYHTADNDEESVDMDELLDEDSEIEEDADPEPDSDIKSTDDEEVEEVKDTTKPTKD